MRTDRALRSRLEAAGQEWLLDHLGSLDPVAGAKLANQLAGLDLELIERIRAGEELAPAPTGALEPLPYTPASERDIGTDAARKGADALAAGKVGFVILAGGQASRLRYDGPKGAFPIGPRSERSLFQILVEQVLRGARDAGRSLPLAITTSIDTDAAIRAFFETHDCFGFPREDLSFACQGQLPALDEQGCLLLAEKDRVFTNPDGHGGALRALETSGILAAWEQRGVDRVACSQIDNPILRVVDPDFIGRAKQIATKIVLKRKASEKVGVVARSGGRCALVEYSDLSEEESERTDDDGQLTYRLGSIAVHVFRLDFLRRELLRSLPLHVAKKEIPCVDRAGAAQFKTGTKYERFLFDLFPRAEEIAVCEVERAREFEPLKNFAGEHSPEVVRAALDREYRRWYEQAGIEPPSDAPLELSPLDVMGPDDLSR
ncbi:MAG: UTP--glucose-1-phosphate uridylyltransferase [Planctomycetota bacterium]